MEERVTHSNIKVTLKSVVCVTYKVLNINCLICIVTR